MAIPVGIVGFRGYSGAELVSLLDAHPGVEAVLLEHRHDAEHRPQPLRSKPHRKMACTADHAREAGVEVIFLATPPEVSMELAQEFLRAGIRVIDISGAFRLGTAENFAHWYKEEHKAPELMAEAVYGLPEFYRDRVPGARLIANPGCYPTAANLAIRPLMRSGLLAAGAQVVCDAKSGVSGAGRKPSLKTSFCEVTENFSAYSILHHRHVPEVLMNSGLQEADFYFTAQLIPIDRGILETIYTQLKPGTTVSQILDLYEKEYQGEAFVRLYEPYQVPDIRSVARTNFCDLGFSLDSATGRLVVVSAIDNLVKGAAGQAVQNMNLLLGFPEAQGLLPGSAA
jgi:N-acetyl-gamma-glutamyl-phosphate reductase